MKCPYCGFRESKVVDSRPAEEGTSIRRRRECIECGRRFTTYEIVESLPLVVVKRDGSRQSFDRRKVLDRLEQLALEIEQGLQNSLDREITTDMVGQLVLEKLWKVDEVAYVRFASVYRQFKDINTFMTELNKLLEDK